MIDIENFDKAMQLFGGKEVPSEQVRKEEFKKNMELARRALEGHQETIEGEIAFKESLRKLEEEQMSEYKKYTFVEGKPVKVKFDYDRGQEKEGKGGSKYWLFGGVIDGEKQSFSANEHLHSAIMEHLKEAGQELQIVMVSAAIPMKKAAVWLVIDPAKDNVPGHSEVKETPRTERIWDTPIVTDKELMKTCWKEAQELFEELHIDTDKGLRETAISMYIQRSRSVK